MAWKYIMFENTIGEQKVLFPVIFPDKMVHKEVALALRSYQPGWKVKIISAGMISELHAYDLHGHSESLNLDSKESDEDIINLYGYNHGIV